MRVRLLITSLRINFFTGFKRSIFSKRCILPLLGVFVILLMLGIILTNRRNQQWVNRFFALFHGWATLSIMVPLGALYLSISAIGDERESGSLVYITSRPVPRFTFPMGRGLGAGVAAYFYSVTLVVGSIILFNILNRIMGDELNLDPSHLKALLVSTFVSCFCFTALGMFLGSFLKRGLLFGTGLVLGWEVLIGSLMIFNKITGLNSLLITDTTRKICFLYLPDFIQNQIRKKMPLLGKENISELFTNATKYFLVFFILSLIIFSIKEHPYRRKD